MGALAAIGAVLGAVVLIGGAVKAWPSVWTFLCLPGRIEERLQKLDGLDEIKATAEEAIAEWRGAVDSVTTLAGDHEHRLAELERWKRKVERERKSAEI